MTQRAFFERMRADPGEPARHWMRARWKLLSVAIAAVLGVATLNVWLATCGFDACPSPARIRSYQPSEGGRILDRRGQMFGRIEPIRRINVPLADVPVHVRQAFLATEDRRFYEHHGVDARGVVRAMVRNATSFGVREGSSTITMQVVRNTFLDDRYRNRSVSRKLLELRIARLLENTLPKDKILELYLNAIYLGGGVHGVEGASRDLFGKRVRDINLAEAATLAALPKAPSVYTPRRDTARAKSRRDLVLSLMRREGFISEREVKTAAAQPMRVSKVGWERTSSPEPTAISAVREMVDSLRADLGIRDLDVGDLVVHTTLDATAQRAADRAIQRRAVLIQRESGVRAGPDNVVQGALVALDPANGEIRAVVGGSQFKRGDFNRALDAHRQPGSAFKPFVYAAALRAGLSPATMVDDEPVEIMQGRTPWRPANFGGEYAGRVSLRRALARSANAATVRVSRAVGESRVVEVARNAGIASPLTAVPSIALGAFEVTPIEIAAAYAAFGNGGYRVTPTLIRKVEQRGSGVVWQATPTIPVQVMDARDAFQLTSMLRSVVDEGTGSVVRAMGIRGPVAGKTGTTNDGTDVWFVGYTPTIVAAVWFGYDTPRTITQNASGGRLAGPAWAEFYRDGWRETGTEQSWAPPAGMVGLMIDPESGELARDWCPERRHEWFKAGTEPTEYCSFHRFPDGVHWIGPWADRIVKVLKKIWP